MFSVVLALEGVVQVSKMFCWSDSLDSLFWIKEDKRRAIFVENRVKKIRRAVPPVYWRYCPGNKNPADLPSRGHEKLSNVNDKLNEWLIGPGFIYDTLDKWPEDISEISRDISKLNKNISGDHHEYSKLNFHETTIKEEKEEFENEIRNRENYKLSTHVDPKIVINEINEDRCYSIGGLREKMLSNIQKKNNEIITVNVCGNDIQARINMVMDINRYSSYTKLLRITAYLLRFVHNASHERSKKNRKVGYLTQEDLVAAERLWIQASQQAFYDVKQMKQLKIC